MKGAIGKDLSKIAMPVNFNEPLSFTQRIVEDMEYSSLLDKASNCADPYTKIAQVAAFASSPFANHVAGSVQRTGKPFNPLLGETFELDRRHGARLKRPAFALEDAIGSHACCRG
jgi:hypothetical protein